MHDNEALIWQPSVEDVQNFLGKHKCENHKDFVSNLLPKFVKEFV